MLENRIIRPFQNGKPVLKWYYDEYKLKYQKYFKFMLEMLLGRKFQKYERIDIAQK
jgi:hypothetical protein